LQTAGIFRLKDRRPCRIDESVMEYEIIEKRELVDLLRIRGSPCGLDKGSLVDSKLKNKPELEAETSITNSNSKSNN
jgi:hypothetical protein